MFCRMRIKMSPIGTLSDQFNLVVNKNRLTGFSLCVSRTLYDIRQEA